VAGLATDEIPTRTVFAIDGTPAWLKTKSM